MNRCLLVVVILMALFASACFASGEFPELEASLDRYTQWKTIEVSQESRGNVTNFRSDGPALALVEAFQKVDVSRYSELSKWLSQHQKTAPAPLYWEVAEAARKAGAPNAQTLRLLSMGIMTAMYDLQRCTDSKTTSGAFMTLIMTHPELAVLKESHKAEYTEGLKQGLAWFKTSGYDASPMWACSLSLNAFQPAEKPVGYADLVTPQASHAQAWENAVKTATQALAKLNASQ